MSHGRGMKEREGTAAGVWAEVDAAERSLAQVQEALGKPRTAAIVEAARLMEGGVEPAMRACAERLAASVGDLSPQDRLSLYEALTDLRARMGQVGRVLDGAARLYAGRAEELASWLGYTQEGATLPLSVVRSAGRRCNLQA
jgi:hypothetical protein